MRSALLAASLALTSLVAPPIADACGGYQAEILPAVYALSRHHTPGTHRMFVTIASYSEIESASWKDLAPGTFDRSQIAAAPKLDKPQTITLVGPAGTQVVTAERAWYLRDDFTSPRKVLEVPARADGQFAIALPGTQRDAKWIAADDRKVTAKHIATATTLQLDTELLYVSKLAGTRVELLSGARDGTFTTYVLVDGNVTRSFYGAANGALVIDNVHYVIGEQAGTTRVVRI